MSSSKRRKEGKEGGREGGERQTDRQRENLHVWSERGNFYLGLILMSSESWLKILQMVFLSFEINYFLNHVWLF